MKNLFFFLLLLMPLQLLADEAIPNNDKSQQEALLQRENSASKTVDFLKSHSSFTKYEYYALPDVGKGSSRIGNDVVIITDIVSKEKIGCLRVSNSRMLQSSGIFFFRNRYAGVLDYDELDDMIKSCEYIQSVVLETKAEVPTKIDYVTLDGVKLEAEWEEGVRFGYYEERVEGWNVYLRTHYRYFESEIKIHMKYFPQFIQNLKDAKEVILSKLK